MHYSVFFLIYIFINLELLANEIDKARSLNTQFVIAGDFNADLKRQKRFDKYLKKTGALLFSKNDQT